jgi:hypothetical protein
VITHIAAFYLLIRSRSAARRVFSPEGIRSLLSGGRVPWVLKSQIISTNPAAAQSELLRTGLSTFPDLCSLETRVADYFALTEINRVFMDGRWTEDAFPTTYLLYPRVNSFS